MRNDGNDIDATVTSDAIHGLSCVYAMAALVYLAVSRQRSNTEERAPLLVTTESADPVVVGAAPSRRIGAAMVSLSLVRVFVAGTVSVNRIIGDDGQWALSLTPPLAWVFALAILVSEKPFGESRLFKVIPDYISVLSWFYAMSLISDCINVYDDFSVVLPSNGSSHTLGTSVISLISAPITLALLVLNIYQINILHDHIERQRDEAYASASQLVPSRESNCSLLSRLSFSWINPMMRLGQRRPLEILDIPDISENWKAASAIKEFQQYRGRFKSLMFTLLWSERRRISRMLAFALVACLLTMNGPFFLYKITGYIKDPQGQSIAVAFLYVFCLAGFILIRAVAFDQCFHIARIASIRIKAVLVDDIYQKSLHSRPTGADEGVSEKKKGGKAGATVGKIVTLMSSDAETVKERIIDIPDVIIVPVQIIAATAGLCLIVGWPALVGLAVMVCKQPVSYHLAKWQETVFGRLLSATDKRTNIVNEALQGIRIIKYFSWETKFLQKIEDARAKEMRCLIDFYIQGGIGGLVWMFGPILVSFVTLVTMTTIAGIDLDVQTAFTCLSLFNAIRIPLTLLPEAIVNVIQMKVSADRIEKFLMQEELEKYCVTEETMSETNGEAVIGIRDGCFRWNSSRGVGNVYIEDDASKKAPALNSTKQSSNEKEPLLRNAESSSSLASGMQIADDSNASGNAPFTLRGINASFPSGGLTAICGATGAGKSSLVQALLGEMTRLSGTTTFPDPRFARPRSDGELTTGVAYVAQQSWLQNATIRDNILFGEPYDPDRYGRVIRACELVRDLDTFEAGDLTEIGEKGINLSGGQKQRVALARATYSRASCVLLDDPLSAVDAPTARHLFENVVLGLLRGRTRILVTHAAALVLPAADHVIVMAGGEVVAAGNVHTVMHDPETKSLLDFETSMTSLDPAPSTLEDETTDDGPVKDYANGKSTKDARRLVEVEVKENGAVKLSVYTEYVSAAGGPLFLCGFVIFMVLQRCAIVANDYWVKTWAEAYDSAGAANHTAIADSIVNNLTSSDHSVDVRFYISVYGLIGVAWLCIYALGFGVKSIGQYRAARNFHRDLMQRIFNAPIRFFDRTPIGRILNRASNDIATIDRNLMTFLDQFLSAVLDASTVIVVVASVTPVFLVAMVPVCGVYYAFARRYLDTARELKRLELITRSPLYTMFSETLTGAATIRAFGVEQRFIEENRGRVDTNNRAFMYLTTTSRWLSVRMSLIGATMILLAGASMVLARDIIGAGLAALALTWALNFSSNVLVVMIRKHSALEMSMNSVERVREYMGIEQEGPAVIRGNVPPAGWPMRGDVSVEGLEMRYAPKQEAVLRDVTFSVKGGQKVGIVGRTGAGKTSLSLSFFRIVEASRGRIVIDGIDISKIGLHDLRSSLTMIPQDPVLFAGTIRSNLDPFSEHGDAELWRCLDKVQFLDSLQGGTTSPCAFSLDTGVSEGGSNYSQGQRQLLCLARALLKCSTVTILDEATASVDNATDGRIQEVIRGPEFAAKTVLAIAHRLRTVVDYDLILVLDEGRVVEFGFPCELMMRSDGGGLFRRMCVESGEFEELLAMAVKTR